MVSADGGMETELKHRLGERAQIVGGLSDLWRNRGMTTDVKTEMLESIVVPAAMYESESWIMREKDDEDV